MPGKEEKTQCARKMLERLVRDFHDVLQMCRYLCVLRGTKTMISFKISELQHLSQIITSHGLLRGKFMSLEGY